jgi:hypothetical protein
MERVIRKQNYKNAFNCKRCPGTDDETGCPDWWRWEEKNEKGEARIVEQCGRAAAKHFEIQRLNNTRFVVDNVVATKNAIAETGQKLIHVLRNNPDFIEALNDKQIPSDRTVASSIGHGSQGSAGGGFESPSDYDGLPPCASPEFSNY